MAKDIDKIIEFLKAECDSKKNTKRSVIRYSQRFKTGVNDLYKSGLTDKQILKLIPISIYSIHNWTGRNKDKRFEKVKVVNNKPIDVATTPRTKNSNERIEKLLVQIKTILLVELVLIILLIIYL